MDLTLQQQDLKVPLDTSLKNLQKTLSLTSFLSLFLVVIGCSEPNISASKDEIPAKAFSLADVTIEPEMVEKFSGREQVRRQAAILKPLK